MELHVSLVFNGNCKEALEFYTNIFKVPMPELMLYGDMPQNPDFPLSEEDKKRIMYTNIEILGVPVMLSDSVPGEEYTLGKNMGLAVVGNNLDEIKKIYEALKEGGKVQMELQKTPWSEAYGMLTDKFGIDWQLDLEPTAE